MIKIEKYKLSNYKNIKEAYLSLNNFNVIIGPNNSGKSNFIQSISFLNFLINSSTDELGEYFKEGFYVTHFNEPASRFRTHGDDYDKKKKDSILFNLKISNSDTNRVFFYNLRLEWISKSFETSYKIAEESLEVKKNDKPGKASTIFNRTGNSVKYGSGFSKTSVFETIPDSFSVVRILKLIAQGEEYEDAIKCLNTVIKAPIFYFSNTELLKLSNTERLNSFNGRTIAFNLEEEIIALEEEKKFWEIFKSAIQNILNIEDVKVFRWKEGGDKSGKVVKHLSFDHLGDQKNINQMSDGSILIIAIITKILSSDEQIIFIEEPENSTHPRALVDLLAFFKSFLETKQFVITSHSIALLNKTKIDDVIASCVNSDGQSEFFNISSKKDLKKKLRQGHINFSDELFFADIQGNEEFEFQK